MIVLKKKIHEECMNVAQEKCYNITKNIMRIQESLSSESKSTAGDKHETGRAMLQLEREKLGLQLKNAEEILEVLKRINPEREQIKVVLGSYVKTNKAVYYLAAFLGEIMVEGNSVYVISAQSPIGRLILGKSVNDHFQFNGNSQTILEVI